MSDQQEQYHKQPTLQDQSHRTTLKKSAHDPYPEEERTARLAAASAEYEMLAKKKAFADRVSKGIGVDWNVIQHISK